MKIILDGEFVISDASGEEVTATAGDLFYFPKGGVITFRTNDFDGKDVCKHTLCCIKVFTIKPLK